MPFTCRYCGQPHCAAHRLPENHDCAGLEEYKEQLREQGRLMAETPQIKVRREAEAEEEERGGLLGGLGRGRAGGGPGGGPGRGPGGGPGGAGGGGLIGGSFGTGGPTRTGPGRAGLLRMFRGQATFALLALMAAVTVAGWTLSALYGSGIYRTFFAVHATSYLYPWTVVTSIFAHGGVMHLLINGLILFFFGPAVERRIGTRSFVALFVTAGAVGGVGQVLFSSALGQPAPVLGASGAILGLMGVLLVLEPDAQVLLMFLIPMPLWVLVGLFALFDFAYLFQQDGVAHLAHLAGLAVGIVAAKHLETRSRRAAVEHWGA